MLVRSDDSAIDIVKRPVELALAIGLLLEGVQDPLENTRVAPAVEAAGHRTPGTIALREIPPRGSGAENPQHAVENRSMVIGGSPSIRFWGWEEGYESRPLLVRQVFSVHTSQYTGLNRVCKHALGICSFWL